MLIFKVLLDSYLAHLLQTNIAAHLKVYDYSIFFFGTVQNWEEGKGGWEVWEGYKSSLGQDLDQITHC